MEDPKKKRSVSDDHGWARRLHTEGVAHSSPGLLARYWSPVYAFLRRRGDGPDAAAALAETVLIRIVADPRRLATTGPARGRFRTFLKGALEDPGVETLRPASPDVPPRRALVPHEHAALEAAEPEPGTGPEDAFDRQWAAATLGVAMSRLEGACRSEGRESSWDVFRKLVLDPVLDGAEPRSLDSLASGDVDDPETASTVLSEMMHRCRDLLREVVAETIDDPHDLDDELRTVQAHLMTP